MTIILVFSFSNTVPDTKCSTTIYFYIKISICISFSCLSFISPAWAKQILPIFDLYIFAPLFFHPFSHALSHNLLLLVSNLVFSLSFIIFSIFRYLPSVFMRKSMVAEIWSGYGKFSGFWRLFRSFSRWKRVVFHFFTHCFPPCWLLLLWWAKGVCLTWHKQKKRGHTAVRTLFDRGSSTFWVHFPQMPASKEYT